MGLCVYIDLHYIIVRRIMIVRREFLILVIACLVRFSGCARFLVVSTTDAGYC